MKPKFLYHGSSVDIKDEYLEPRKATDKSRKENNLKGVYATDRKDIALGMSLVKEARAFSDYEKEPCVIVFVEGQPQGKSYLYTVSSETFEEKPKGSHQWVSEERVKILKKEEFNVKDLKDYWRFATKEEEEGFYKGTT